MGSGVKLEYGVSLGADQGLLQHVPSDMSLDPPNTTMYTLMELYPWPLEPGSIGWN